jgi:hypothetical protein
MIRFEMFVSNQECEALDAVLADVEATLLRQIGRELPDDFDHATPAYVALGRLLAPVRSHLARLAALRAEENQRDDLVD